MLRSVALLLLLLVRCSSAWQGEVTLKLAVDMNGAVDDLAGKAERFTSPVSLDAVHRLRRCCDAVLVGATTVCRDNPSLTVRRVPADRQPLRVVVDPNGRIPEDSTLLTDDEAPTVVFGGDRWTSLQDLLETLWDQYDVRHLMVEGGPMTASSFLDAQLVDRAIIVRAPITFDNEPVPSTITSNVLRQAGLTFHSRHNWARDDVHMWIREPTLPNWEVLEEN